MYLNNLKKESGTMKNKLKSAEDNDYFLGLYFVDSLAAFSEVAPVAIAPVFS